jgi:hypothetical protein
MKQQPLTPLEHLTDCDRVNMTSARCPACEWERFHPEAELSETDLEWLAEQSIKLGQCP